MAEGVFFRSRCHCRFLSCLHHNLPFSSPDLVCPLLAPCSRCRNHFPTCRHCQSSFSSSELLSAFLALERRLPTQSLSSFLELLSLELALQLLVLLKPRSFWELPFSVWARQSLSRSRRQNHKISSRRLFWGLRTFWSWVHYRSRCHYHRHHRSTEASWALPSLPEQAC